MSKLEKLGQFTTIVVNCLNFSNLLITLTPHLINLINFFTLIHLDIILQ